MKTKLLLASLALIIGIGSFEAGRHVPVFGGTTAEDEAAKKHAIMADYIWLNARLNQPPTIDIATASTQEWADAYIDAIAKYAVPVPAKTQPTDLNEAMKEKASQLEVFCSDPTSTKAEAAAITK